MYKFRLWLSNKISDLSLWVHPDSKKHKEMLLKLLMDRAIYGHSICRIDPDGFIK